MHLCKVRSCDRMSSVCLSVRPTVTLADCDHIGWNSSETISQLVSLGCSLSADPNIRGLLQGEHPKILAQSDQPCWFEQRRHSIANCSRMVTDSATVTITMEPIGNHQSFEWCHRWPPTTSSGSSICVQDTRMAIYPQRVIRYTSCLVLG